MEKLEALHVGASSGGKGDASVAMSASIGALIIGAVVGMTDAFGLHCTVRRSFVRGHCNPHSDTHSHTKRTRPTRPLPPAHTHTTHGTNKE